MSGSNSTRLLKFRARGGAASVLREHARAAIAGAGQVPLARLRVRAHGAAHRHVLGTWHADPDRPGVDTIACLHCGAGAALDVEAARESLSDALLQECRS